MSLTENPKYIHEPTPLQCGQAALAMLSDTDVEEIVKLTSTERETDLKQMFNALQSLGINYKKERQQVQKKEQLPSIALLSLETPKCWHWSLYFKGKFYDPEYGVLDDFPPSNRRYYWEITESMTDEKIIEEALKEGFYKAYIIPTGDIVFDPVFRPFCEENICGQYGINYSCPPDCGTPEEMKNRILAHKKALVLQTVWTISDLADSPAIKKAKGFHNKSTIKLVKKLRQENITGIIVGSSGCNLCKKCAKQDNKPCPLPEFAFSCMSAYCIYVKKLADRCNMEYTYQNDHLPLFGMYVFD